MEKHALHTHTHTPSTKEQFTRKLYMAFVYNNVNNSLSREMILTLFKTIKTTPRQLEQSEHSFPLLQLYTSATFRKHCKWKLWKQEALWTAFSTALIEYGLGVDRGFVKIDQIFRIRKFWQEVIPSPVRLTNQAD